MKPFLRRARDDDFWRFYGAHPPSWWAGIVAEDAHMLLGIGGVYLGVDGRLWCAFEKCRGVAGKKLMQRAALLLLGSLKEAGIAEVHTLADPAIARSEFWLERLGFRPTAELHDNLTVWKWQHSQS